MIGGLLITEELHASIEVARPEESANMPVPVSDEAGGRASPSYAVARVGMLILLMAVFLMIR